MREVNAGNEQCNWYHLSAIERYTFCYYTSNDNLVLHLEIQTIQETLATV